MKILVIIPAHNEAEVIEKTLDSLIGQTLIPNKLIVVNDNSSDQTEEIVCSYSNRYSWIRLVNKKSSDTHLPGSKIVEAFNEGLNDATDDFDLICKYDADLVFPKNYLEVISTHFNSNPELGMAAGFCYIEKNGNWVLEDLTRKDHIRGALKCYRKECFQDIGGLRPAMGWDTIDELLSEFYGWQLLTDESLHVKHLKPTGSSYNHKAKYLQGQAMYCMRYGFLLTVISGLKLSLKKKRPLLFIDYLNGYRKAKLNNVEFLVTKEQGQFIRSKRWSGIWKKLF